MNMLEEYQIGKCGKYREILRNKLKSELYISLSNIFPKIRSKLIGP